MTIPEIGDYPAWWRQTTREHILPKRTTGQFIEEGRLQAELIQTHIDNDWAVLEYGSGTGRIIQFIKAETRYALDVNLPSLSRTPQGIRRLHTDGLTIPLPDDSIDFIYSIMVLQHCTKSHHRPILTEMLRVLKPGRKAYVQLPRDPDYYTQTTGTNLYTVEEIESYVPDGTEHLIQIGSLPGYADGVHNNREWILTFTKAERDAYSGDN